LPAILNIESPGCRVTMEGSKTIPITYFQIDSFHDIDEVFGIVAAFGGTDLEDNRLLLTW
jgi:hypothetical protein